MKNIFLSFIAIAVCFTWTGCSEDFEVAAPPKEIMAVYGMLNMADTAHYIRIQKAFLDENKSAITMAQVADSNFYDSLDVKIRQINGGAIVRTDNLQRVDLNLEGYPKEPGLFFTSPNYAYKYTQPLVSNRNYRLVVTNTATGEVDSSEVPVVDTGKLSITNINSSQYKLEFSRTVPADVRRLLFVVSHGPEVRYMEGRIRFKWVDVNMATGVQTDKAAELVFASGPTASGSQQNLRFPNISVYTFLRDAMKLPAPNVARYLDSCDIFIHAAGEDYYQYVITNQIQAGGLTADQIKPLYTNIQGKDAYGLFSSRGSVYRMNVPLDSLTYDSLRANPITQPLNIQGFSDH